MELRWLKDLKSGIMILQYKTIEFDHETNQTYHIWKDVPVEYRTENTEQMVLVGDQPPYYSYCINKS